MVAQNPFNFCQPQIRINFVTPVNYQRIFAQKYLLFKRTQIWCLVKTKGSGAYLRVPEMIEPKVEIIT